MKICPAILTNNLEVFKEKLRDFQVFDTIDIDIVIPGNLTQTKKTVSLQDAVDAISKYPIKTFRIHLMCDFPLEVIRKVKNQRGLNIIYILHQESSFNIDDVKRSKSLFGLAIKDSSDLRTLEYYKNFVLVQVMSVEIGGQGNEFEVKALEKVKELRKLGYDREVALDGGINLSTVSLLKNLQIDSLSVGSYFSKSLDIVEDYKKMSRALNNKS